MKNCFAILVAGVCLGLAAPGWALDSVKISTATAPVNGQITSISSVQVVVEQGALSKEIPVNEILYLSFDEDPSALRTVRAEVHAGRFEDALASVEKLDPADATRKEVAQDIEFYKAYCAAKLALGGQGKVQDAGRLMIGFITKYPQNYHYFQAAEVIGDLLVANGTYAKAETYYGMLAKAPWPEYKLRVAVAMGRALLAQGKTAEAEKSFDQVLANRPSGSQGEAQVLAAQLGKARCMAAGGKSDEAIKSLQEIIVKTDSEQSDVMAQVYNALGTAHRKAGRPKDAMLAFLHVDVLYSQLPEAHAEALANLSDLWDTLHFAARANRCRQVLNERYGDSRWAQERK